MGSGNTKKVGEPLSEGAAMITRIASQPIRIKKVRSVGYHLVALGIDNNVYTIGMSY